jgi:hypothetical protein
MDERAEKVAGPPLVPIAPGNYDRAWNDPPLFGWVVGVFLYVKYRYH